MSNDPSNEISLINYYRRKILTGQIAIGEQLPSIHALAERHNISEQAASAIYEALSARGLAEQGPRTRSPGAMPSLRRPDGED